MPILGIIAPLLKAGVINNVYWLGYFWGATLWLMGALTFYLILTTIRNASREKILKTVSAFFTLNIIISLLQLALIMKQAHSLVPYWVLDTGEKFGTSTGDNIYGISGNSSITNAAISSAGVIYFLLNGNLKMVIACTFIVLLCTSNLSIIFLGFLLVLILIFSRSLKIKMHTLIAVIVLCIYPALSPANIDYIKNTAKNLAHPPTVGQKQKRNENRRGFFSSPDYLPTFYTSYHPTEQTSRFYIAQLKAMGKSDAGSTAGKGGAKLDSVVVGHYFAILYGHSVAESPLAGYSKSGKIFSYHQTVHFLKGSYTDMILGAGIGRFSSKTAVKMTGLSLQGKYPSGYVYASPEFFQNHLYTILYYLSKDVSYHSVINFPDSVYNQIAGEYGFLGIVAFAFLYLYFFVNRKRKYNYGYYLLILTLLFFGLEYWFEDISFTVVFELLMLLDIFTPQNKNVANSASNSINARI
jgi:hypothetical protein